MEPWYRDWDCFVYVHELADAEGVNMATGWMGGINTGTNCFVYVLNELVEAECVKTATDG